MNRTEVVISILFLSLLFIPFLLYLIINIIKSKNKKIINISLDNCISRINDFISNEELSKKLEFNDICRLFTILEIFNVHTVPFSIKKAHENAISYENKIIEILHMYESDNIEHGRFLANEIIKNFL